MKFTKEELYRAAVKYGRAIAHSEVMGREIAEANQGRPFEIEVSVDETESPTSALEQLFFGPELKGEGTDADLFTLAQRVAASPGPKPRLFLCCGTEDELLGDNHAFHGHLDSVHLEHTYEEGPGFHEWGYWDAQIQRVLNWLPL